MPATFSGIQASSTSGQVLQFYLRRASVFGPVDSEVDARGDYRWRDNAHLHP